MAKKKTDKTIPPKQDVDFGALDDDFFKTGDTGKFWEEDEPSAAPLDEESATEIASEAQLRAAEAARREAAAKDQAAKDAAAREAAAKEAASVAAAKEAASAAAAKEAASAAAAKEAASAAAAERQAREASAREAAKQAAQKEAAQKAAAQKEAAQKETAAREAAQKEAAREAAAREEAIKTEPVRKNQPAPGPRAPVSAVGARPQVSNPTIVAIENELLFDDDLLMPDSGYGGASATGRPEPDSESVSTADEFLEADADPSLVKRRKTPEPPRQVPEPPPASRPAAAPAAAPVAELAPPVPAGPAYKPSEVVQERWGEAVQALEREIASETDEKRKARLAAEAGWILFYRLGDADRARPHVDAAIAAMDSGSIPKDDRLLRAAAEIVGRKDDPEALHQALVRRAEGITGGLAAELFLDAAAILHNHLRRDDDAKRVLEKALAQSPDDWIALRALRDAHARAQDWPALDDTLAKMAERIDGPLRAALLLERANLHEDDLQDDAGALAISLDALAADPSSAPAFLAAERIASRRGDHATLVQLYEGAADQADRDDAPVDRALWLSLAARARSASNRPPAEVRDAYRKALAALDRPQPEVSHELTAFLERTGAHDALAEALVAEAETVPAADKPWLLLEAAEIFERGLAKPKKALELYEQVLSIDPKCEPAQDAVARLLVTEGRGRDLLKSLVQALDGVEGDARVAALFRIAEIAEGLGENELARDHYEQTSSADPSHLLALEGLERVYTRLEAWESLAENFVAKAVLASTPDRKAVELHRAAALYEDRTTDLERAAELYRQALTELPDYPPSLDAYIRIMEKLDNWPGLAAALRNAARAHRKAGSNDRTVTLNYRAARVLADKVGDRKSAIACLRECIEVNARFLPALTLLRELSEQEGAWEDVYHLQHHAADLGSDPARRAWRLLAASRAAARIPRDAATDVDPSQAVVEVFKLDPSHRAALQWSEDLALRSGNPASLVEMYERRLGAAPNASERARVAERLAIVARESGNQPAALKAIDEILGAGGAERPLRAAARFAESLGSWKAAAQALRAAGTSPAELARLEETYGDDPYAALEAWRAALQEEPSSVVAAAGLDRALRKAGVREGQAEANAILAEAATTPSVRAMHALLAAHFFEESANPDEGRAQAIRFYEMALSARPSVGRAFDALRRIQVAAHDGAALEKLYSRLSPPDEIGLAHALEEAGDSARAMKVYERLVEKAEPDDRLVLLLGLEQAQSAADAWKGVFGTLSERLALSKSAEERSAIEAKRRWVLAEKLASTDEAWEFYRKLHEESPNDSEVLEALARIAGARGETALAIQYLDGLATLSKDRSQSARYQRRVAEAHKNAGNTQAARQAYLKALDFQQDDMEALAGLKDLATREENWQALLGVLAREATMLEGSEQVERNREIARIWQQRIGDTTVASDAWRKVVAMLPGDREAIRELVALAREMEDWPAFAEHGQAYVLQLEGAERSALLSELGRVHLQKLRRQQEAINFLDAASSGDHPDLEAARLLEQVYTGKDWNMVSEAILRQARASEPGARLKLLLRAAQIKLDTLHDRDQAASIFARVLEVDPKNAEALRFQGDYLYHQKRWEKAVEVFTRMEEGELARDLEDFDAKIEVSLYFFRFADALQKLGRHAEARARFERALTLNPSHLPTLEAVGPLYVELEAWDKARAVFGTILQLTGGQGDPATIARVYTNLGTVEQRLGDLDKAMKRFNKALDLRPNDIAALQGIAGVLFARQDWNNLLNVYNNIIYHAQEPGEVLDAYLTKGFVLDAKLHLPDKAEQHYQKSLALNPAQPTALLRLAELALRRQDWPEGASLADRGLSLDSGTATVRAGLLLVKAVAHKAAGDERQAMEAYRGALAADPSIATELGKELGSHRVAHEALTARLQARV